MQQGRLLALAGVLALTAADHFSIETSNVTEKLVSDVYNTGKEIYVDSELLSEWIAN